MAFIHAVAIAAFLVLGTAMKSGACPLMGKTCTTVSDQEVLNSLQASNVSNVMVDLAVSATLEDLLNEAGDFRWFQGTIPLYRRLPRNCNSSSVCGCNLTYSSHYDRLYGTHSVPGVTHATMIATEFRSTCGKLTAHVALPQPN